MYISRNLCLMAAKSDYTDNNKWLPFWIHSEDTANIIKYLINTRYYSLKDICGYTEEKLEHTAVLLGLLHDIGKVTPVFQAKLLNAIPRMREKLEHYNIEINDYKDFNCPSDSYHSRCGEVILQKFGFANDFSSIVGAHHGMPENGDVSQEILINPKHYYGCPPNRNQEFWTGLWSEWIENSLIKAGFQKIGEIPELNKKTQVILSGLLIMADWIASNQTYFDLFDIDCSEDDLYVYPENRLNKAVGKINFPEIWSSEQNCITADDFKNQFSFDANEIQKTMCSAVNDCVNPGIFILEAPMGTGKTEAALAAAEVLAEKDKKSGVFFGLPTQATANGIFTRIVKWAKFQSKDACHSIMLAHSNNNFNPVFSSIPKSIPAMDEDCDSDDGLVVHSFFSGKKQACLSDFVIGTVDQLLMAALKKRYVMLRHLGLSQKVVIIDECHAYDAFMNMYLDRALKWMNAYHVPVVLLSATLPVKRRGELIAAYAGNSDACNFSEAYPLLTYTDGGRIIQKEIHLPAENKSVEICHMNESGIFENVRETVKQGGCVGIICNTIKKAQHYMNITSQIPGAKRLLYHSLFILPDRADKETQILKEVGKDSRLKQRRGVIIIGTQVLEQSLDIDFDLLVTDLCPMDLLIQRIGRLHRHEVHDLDRPPVARKPRCIIIENTIDEEKASESIYTKWLLMRTEKLLPKIISIPRDIADLVHKTYDDDKITQSDADCNEFEQYQKMIAIKKAEQLF